MTIGRGAAAQEAVAAFLAHAPIGDHGEVEVVEVVHLRSDQDSATVPGVSLQWRQGPHEFGLLMPIDRLISQAGGLDGVAFYLHLAVDEPHGGSPDGTRAWFTDLPSGPY